MPEAKSELPLVLPEMPLSAHVGENSDDILEPWLPVSKLFGVTYDLDATGVERLHSIMKAPDARCMLVVVLYPACRTNKDHLLSLIKLMTSCQGRLEVRMLPVNSQIGSVTSLGAMLPASEARIALIGSSPNLFCEPAAGGRLNMAFRPTADLFNAWHRWFDQLWSEAITLQASTCDIPYLVPAKGASMAARAWVNYVDKCLETLNARGNPRAEASILPFPLQAARRQSGLAEERSSDNAPGQPAETTSAVSSLLGLPQIDNLAEGIAKLYQKGRLVSIDKSTVIPPLSISVKPDWLGLRSLRREGAAERTLSYRVSIFGEKEQKSLEKARGSAQQLLSKLSYSLADGQWWVPNSAVTLLESKLDEENANGITYMKSLISGNTEKFVQEKRETVRKSVEALYQEFFPRSPLPDAALDKIMAEFELRLRAASNERILPLFSYTPVAFDLRTETPWSSPWGQPLRLLCSIAEFPRNAITGGYFQRGPSVDLNEAVVAMNVMDDDLIRAWPMDPWSTQSRAKRELNLLKTIKVCEAEQRDKCTAVVDLMAGRPLDEIYKMLKGAEARALANKGPTQTS